MASFVQEHIVRSRRLALLAIEILVPVIVILLIAPAGYKDSFHVPSFGRIWAAFKERWLWTVLPSMSFRAFTGSVWEVCRP